MNHLVLGSAGQIGKYVVNHIMDHGRTGDEVTEWDIVYGSEQDLRGGEDASPEIEQLISQADFVHFLAFDVGGSTYLKKYQDTFEFIDNNVKIMENVFNLLRKYNKPFYFASSQMSNMFHSNYGRLKAVGEAYTKAAGGLNVHFWNVYGYEDNPEKSHVITDFIHMALNEGKICTRTTGTEKRCLTYAEDVAKILYGITQKYDVLRQLNQSNDDYVTIEQDTIITTSQTQGNGGRNATLTGNGGSWTMTTGGNAFFGDKPIGTVSSFTYTVKGATIIRNDIPGGAPIPVTRTEWTSIRDVAYLVAKIVSQRTGTEVKVYAGDLEDDIQGTENKIPRQNQILEMVGFKGLKDWADESFTSLEDGIGKIVDKILDNE